MNITTNQTSEEEKQTYSNHLDSVFFKSSICMVTLTSNEQKCNYIHHLLYISHIIRNYSRQTFFNICRIVCVNKITFDADVSCAWVLENQRFQKQVAMETGVEIFPLELFSMWHIVPHHFTLCKTSTKTEVGRVCEYMSKMRSFYMCIFKCDKTRTWKGSDVKCTQQGTL